ncbi:MAG: DUF805 domain-containing protein [Coriobacteriales bacterium]|jgi:uncharacterized membrane protein YhaH (DUF805 family)|nr:DUF805 domain-containing protein [Coriobacteriales bacterium]
MDPIQDFALFWKNYANFTGRTPRRGFWFVQLWLFLISFALSILLAVTGALSFDVLGSGLPSDFSAFSMFIALLMLLFFAATVIPSLALTVRRLHDAGRRWYWMLLPCLPIALILITTVGAAAALFSASAYLIFIVIMSLLVLGCAIFLIVVLASPTSPHAIGRSTHGDIFVVPSTPASDKAAMPVAAPAADVGLAASPYYQKGALVGISGMYNGASFPLNPGETMVLGRDSALSHIVIDQGASKVSRKHVSLTFDPKQKLYYAHDYSSNGTFKDDGSRLPVDTDVALPGGTVISLGNSHNSFKLG